MTDAERLAALDATMVLLVNDIRAPDQ